MSTKMYGIKQSVPYKQPDTVQLAHGSGGRLSNELVEKLILPYFKNDVLERLDDQAVVDLPAGRLAFTTDSYVVSPIFFPGGNIGDLAVNGTINDLCMGGAKPYYISVSFIIEEGFPLTDLQKVLAAMQQAAEKAGVLVVTGDTKVVNRGCCDGLFINTSGVGIVPEGLQIAASNIQQGDAVILSGSIADHGMAVMTSRENLSLQADIVSDTASLHGLVDRMMQTSSMIHAMRDPTRGGVATTLNEWARASRVGIEIIEEALHINLPVKSACEMLGIDPLYVANEGKLIAAVAADAAEGVVQAMRSVETGRYAEIIGRVVDGHPGIVTMKTGLGVSRIIDMPVGEQLPRIC